MNTFLRRMLQTGAALGVFLSSVVTGLALTHSITAPADGTNYALVTSTSGITISGTLTKTNGYSLTSVTLKANSTTIATLTTGLGSWSYTWYPTAAGSYTITATALETNVTDTSVTNTLSSSVGVTVTAVRLLTISSPAANANIPIGSSMFLRATAVASEQQVKQVDYYVDGALVGTASQSPYNVAVTFNQAAGAHTLSATATMSDGTTTFSSANVGFNTISALGSGPTVTLTAPVSGDSIAVNQSVTISATASDSDGYIPSTAGGGVTFLVDGEQVGTSSTNPDLISPYTITWTPTVAKTYSIVAQTVDDKGNVRLSTPVSITASSSVPAVSVTAPSSGSSLTFGSAVTVSASASGGGSASVTSVEFFANGVSLGTDTTAPYSVAWTPGALGSIPLTARVTDSTGATLLSTAVNVVVVAAPSTVSITAPAAGATVAYASSVSVDASAAAATGATVSQVEFFANGVSIGVDTTAPFSVTWTPSTVGSATLLAKVTDSNGTLVSSSSVSVTVSGTRLVTITNPTAGAYFTAGSTAYLRSTVSFTDGSVVKQLDYYLNGVKIGESVTSAPYNMAYTFPTTLSGAQSLKAVVTTADGTMTDSLTQTVNITAPVGTAPTVTLTTPSGSDPVAVGQSVTVTAVAADSDGYIPSTAPGGVTFYVDGDPITAGTGESNPDYAAPYSVTWKPSVPKSYVLRAMTVDDKGNQVMSAPVTIAVQAAVPTVAISSPSNNSSITAGNIVSVTATASGASGAAVSRVDFYENGVLIGTSNAAPYTVSWTPSTVGSRQLTARVTDANNLTATSSTVNATILAAGSSVSITAPSTGATLAHAVATTISATASAATGATVSQVEFFYGTTSIGVDTAAPYSVSWTPFTTGTFSLTAKMTDSMGTVVTSTAVSVTVASTRVVTMTNPTNGATIAQGSSLYARASVVFGDGAILKQVEFFANGVSQGTVTQTPYNAPVTFNTVGAVNLMARATASDGLTTDSPTYTVNVVAPVGSGPSIALTSPNATDPLLVNQNVTLSATASDSDGYIPSSAGTGVSFLVDGDIITPSGTGEANPDLVAPYTVTWKPTVAKSYVITAFTTDDKGNMRLSSPVTVNVLSSVPTVSITSPSNNSSASANASLNITATASGANGAAVTKVDFYDNGALIGSVNALPYTITWSPGTLGSHALTARVTDANGVTATSSAVNVNATAATTAVTITAPLAGATLAHGAATTLTATATPATGATLTQVEFFAGSTSLGLGTAAGSTYSLSWTPYATGSFSLTAKATDSNGTVVTSSAVAVTVSSTRVVTLTNPSNNAYIPQGSRTYVRANVAFGDGAIVRQVEFFAGATSLGIVTQAPYNLPYTFDTVGAISLTAVATAIDGVTTTSPVYTANVVAAVGTGPTVALTTPSAADPLVVNQNITISATAADSDGYIPSVTGGGVTFLVDGEVVSPASTGETNPDLTSPYSITWKPLTAKSYVLTALAVDDKGNMRLSAPVTVNVLSTVPTVAITSPSNNASVTANSTVNIVASASGANGAAVASVDFFDNGVLLGSVTSAPYTYSWVPSVVGAHVLTARITDTNNLTATSSSVSVTVAAATVPTVSITSPVAGSVLAHASAVTVTASAGAPTGSTVAQVEFFAAGVSVGVATTAPYSVSWTPLTTGTIALTAKVTDSTGLTATSSAVSVTVSSTRVVTLSTPTNNSTYPINSTIFMRASVNFADGAPIQKVEFFNGAAQLGIVTQAPYSLQYTFPAVGTYNIKARATATDGTFQDSPVYVVNVLPAVGTPPTVRITAPTGLSSVLVNNAVTITAEASDADGYIPTTTGGGVTFFVDGEPVSGTNPDLTAPYSISWTPGTVKTYSLVAQAIDDKGNITQSAPVLVSVVGAAPSVTITSPTNNASVTVGSQINLVANPVVGASMSAISNVAFYDNGVLIGSAFGSPYSVAWSATTVGTHPITAKVTDASGASAMSSTVNVVVVAGTSTVAITTPSAGTSLLYNSPTTLIASVTPGTGVTVAQVDFLAGGVLIGSSKTAPYGISWTPTTLGAVSLTARMLDTNGNATTSSAVSVTVSQSTNAPTVSLAVSPSGTSVTTNSVRYLVATAADDGAINYVEFFANGISLGQVSTAPYVWAFSAPSSPGTVVLTAKAVDNAGNSTTSSAVTLNVSQALGNAPTVALVSPAPDSYLGVGTSITLTATAADSDGTITQVQFFQNGTAIATDTSSPYTTSWTPSNPGTYALTAIATDNSGNSSMAAAVNVTVVDSTAPSISIAANPSGTVVTVNSTRYITATVSTATGHALDHVEFFLDGVKVGEDSVYPYTYRYTAQSTRGYQTVVARAIDNAGLARDAMLTFEVLPGVGTAPTVSIIGPASGTTVAPGTAVQLAAQAQDAEGNSTITSVQFFVDGTQAGSTDTSSPYTSSFTPALPGSYVIEALATDEKGNNTLSKPVTVKAVYATPTIKMVSPLNNARLTIDTTVAVNATAIGGNNASISSIEYYLDGSLIGVRTSSPFSISWTPDSSLIGEHTITAKVTDANSNTATSAPITVTVSNAVGKVPTVTMTGITNNSTVQSLSTLNLIATAFDSDGSISSVEFFVDYESVGKGQRLQTSNNWRLTYAFPEDALTGTHTIFAAAKDNSGNLIASSVITVNLVTSSSVAPSIDYLAATPDSVIAGQSLSLTAEAIDPDGSVSTVQFWANGTLVGSTSQAPYLVTFTPTTAGRYTVYAVAIDDSGNSVNTSGTVTVNVTGNTAPTVTLTRPVDANLTGTVGQPIYLEATATDPDIGQTLTVDFLANGSVVATGSQVGTTNVYRATAWTPTVANTYQVAARATDSSRGSTTTSFRKVTVTKLTGLAPTVAITVPSSATTASVVPMSASATDIDGSISQVEFFVNGGTIGYATRDQLSNTFRTTYNFGTLGPGTYPVVALVRDNMGNTVVSSSSSITISSGSSTAPTISMKATPSSQSIGQTVELTSSTFDPEGGTLTIQYYANGTLIGSSSSASTSYLVSWTPTVSGTFNFYAVVSDSASNTNVSATVPVIVKSSNPMVDGDAFIIQAYQDLIFDTPNNVELAAVSKEISNGTLTKAGLVARLSARTEYDPTTNALTAYWILMGEWPSYDNFATFQSSAQSSLATTIGQILALPEYGVKWADQPAPTVANFNGAVPLGYEPRKAFINRLYQAALGRTATDLEILQFKSQTQNLAYLARGYDSVGINSAIAELITKQFVTNAAFAAVSKKIEAAGLYYTLLKSQPSTAEISALAALSSQEAVAAKVISNQLYGYRWVTITKHPVSLKVYAGSGALFYVDAVGLPPLTYQWLYNGSAIAGATNAFYSVTDITTNVAGNYSVRVNSTVGSATSDPALLEVSTLPSRLGNISTRGFVGGSNELIAGFVASGTGNRQMLIRAIGPGLSANGVTGAISDTQLDVYRGNNVLASNDNWGTQSTGASLGTVTQITNVTRRVGAFSLTTGSKDAVVLITLAPGAYTVRVRGVGTASGVALVEVYDTTTTISATVKATNVSTRGQVGTGESVLIAGFYVDGAVARRLLIRGVGPTLSTYGVQSPLSNPKLTLYSGLTSTVLLENDDWGTQAESSVIVEAANRSGAFALNANSKDAAMIVMLEPGLYTVQLSGVGGLTGPGLIEVYDVD